MRNVGASSISAKGRNGHVRNAEGRRERNKYKYIPRLSLEISEESLDGENDVLRLQQLLIFIVKYFKTYSFWKRNR